MTCRIRILQKEDQVNEENWLPLSEVTVSGTPNQETQLDMKASTQEAAAIPLSGTASTHRVVLSTIFIRYVKSSLDAGSGPTKSTCTWLNRL